LDSVKKRVDFYLTSDEIESLDRLDEMGIYMNRAEAVRDSMRHLFVDYKLEPFYHAPSEP